MNADDFEQTLRRQPMRSIPPEWRDPILGAGVAKEAAAPVPAWRLWLARFPVAWGTVAAGWIVIIGLNLLISGPTLTRIARSSAPAPTDALTAWSLQRLDSKLLASLLADLPDNAPAAASPVARPRPRSDRRRDDGIGEMRATTLLETFV